MESLIDSLPVAALSGADAVARGVTRLFARSRIAVQREVPLRNNRRADLMGISEKGEVVLVEIKCSRADLLGDRKWTDYLDYCDRFFWAVPHGFDTAPLMTDDFLSERAGLIVADAFDADLVRGAARVPLAPARRKVEVQRLAFLAMARLSRGADPELAVISAAGDWG